MRIENAVEVDAPIERVRILSPVQEVVSSIAHEGILAFFARHDVVALATRNRIRV